MEADLERYLEAGVGRVQDEPACCFSKCEFGKKISGAARETEALVSDLMVDQPLLWLLVSFFLGLLLGKRLFRGN